LRDEEAKQFAIEITQENKERHRKMSLLRDSFTDEEKRDKDRQEAPFDHTRIRVCSLEHHVFLQEISFRSQGTEGTDSF
jgi:hypothetical protein